MAETSINIHKGGKMGKVGKRTHATRYYQGFKHFPLNYARGKVGKVTN